MLRLSYALATLMRRLPLLSKREGSVTPLLALAAATLVVGAGVSIDAGRIYMVKVRAQQAVDAALLGAVSTLGQRPLGTEFSDMFYMNFKSGFLGSTVTSLSAMETATGSGVYVGSVSITVPMALMSVMNAQSANFTVTSRVQRGFGSGSPQELELTMVIDSSLEVVPSSNLGKKLDVAYKGAHGLLEVLFNGQETAANIVGISVVPFNVAVNVGTGKDKWVQPAPRRYYTQYLSNRNFDAPRNLYDDGGNSHPLTEVSGSPVQDPFRFRTPLDQANGLPVGVYTPPIIPFGLRGAQATKPDYAGTTLKPILFMGTRYSEIRAVATSLVAGGGARNNVGMMWGWYTLSSSWQGTWDKGRPGLPKAKAPNLLRVMVLMTEGRNNVFRGNKGSNVTDDDVEFIRICGQVRADDVRLYVVGIGENPNATLLKACAGDPSRYFEAKSNSLGYTVLKTVGNDIMYSTMGSGSGNGIRLVQ